MRVADFLTSAAKMRDGLKVLLSRWDETKQSWDDKVSREFEEKFLETLQPELLDTLDRITRLGQLTIEAEQACSDRRDQ